MDEEERIRKLIVLGDTRLKQGHDGSSLAKARESFEAALAAARAAGVEERVRSLVELRLADLDRLESKAPDG